MPSFGAAWIMAGLTGVGSGAAPLSGSGKTALNAIPIDALSTSRLENFRSRMAFAPLTAASRARALVMLATLECSFVRRAEQPFPDRARPGRHQWRACCDEQLSPQPPRHSAAAPRTP